MKCPNCGSTNVQTQVIQNTTTKQRGCLGWIFWILFTFTIGWIFLIWPLLTNKKSKTSQHVVAVCQNCGRTWTV